MGVSQSGRKVKKISLSIDPHYEWFGPYGGCPTCHLTIDRYCFNHRALYCTECDNSHMDCQTYNLPIFQEKLCIQLEK